MPKLQCYDTGTVVVSAYHKRYYNVNFYTSDSKLICFATVCRCSRSLHPPRMYCVDSVINFSDTWTSDGRLFFLTEHLDKTDIRLSLLCSNVCIGGWVNCCKLQIQNLITDVSQSIRQKYLITWRFSVSQKIGKIFFISAWSCSERTLRIYSTLKNAIARKEKAS